MAQEQGQEIREVDIQSAFEVICSVLEKEISVLANYLTDLSYDDAGTLLAESDFPDNLVGLLMQLKTQGVANSKNETRKKRKSTDWS